MTGPLVVWRFTDGKAGHDNQSAGLLSALAVRADVSEYTLPARDCQHSLISFLRGRTPCGGGLPDPDLLVGAGHATHLPMLATRRARGGRVVVLMKPSLPTRLFDLCIIPEHDRPRHAGNILVTRGVLNRIRNRSEKDEHCGLILVGGPSSHVQWTSDELVSQVRAILKQMRGLRWVLTTSRRTPAELLQLLSGLQSERFSVVPFKDTSPDWLPGMLEQAAQVWVSEDSASMVYEALTSGAAVGLLSVQWRNSSDRLARGIQALMHEDLVTGFDAWRQGAALSRPPEPFDEAGRCAQWILEKWLKEN